MGQFNPINFILFNTQNVVGTNSVNPNAPDAQGNQTTQGALNSGIFANQSQGQSLAGNTTSFMPMAYSALIQTNQGLSAQNQNIISTVQVEQQANYIKDLLNLPRDFEALIEQIESGQNADTQSLKALSKLLVNGKINLSALNALLSQNSKDAVQKLMQTMMQVSKMGAGNVSQLKELMGMLQGTGSMDSAQAVKNLLTLYLPWLPLSMRNDMDLDFNIDIFDKIQGVDPNTPNPDEIIKVMIQTANFGNVLAELELAQNQDVNIYITAAESFPEKKVMEKYNGEVDIQTNVSIDTNKDPMNIEKAAQDVKITSSDYVSPKLVLAAHTLIKIIIEVDSAEFIINNDV